MRGDGRAPAPLAARRRSVPLCSKGLCSLRRVDGVQGCWAVAAVALDASLCALFARIMLKRRKTQSRVYVILGTIARGKALWPRIDRCGRKIPDLTAVFSTTACAGRLPLLGAISFTPLISRVDCLDARVAIPVLTARYYETTTTPLRARYHRFTITNHYVRSLFPPRSQEKTA